MLCFTPLNVCYHSRAIKSDQQRTAISTTHNDNISIGPPHNVIRYHNIGSHLPNFQYYNLRKCCSNISHNHFYVIDMITFISLNNEMKISEISATPTQIFMYLTNACKNRKYHHGLFLWFKSLFK